MSDVEVPTFCEKCNDDPCRFEAFQKDFIETELWTGARELIESKTDPGNIRQRTLRKKLFMSFARFNGAIGIREKHPPCVERGVRELFPSPFYMGFKRTRDDADNSAVDMCGQKLNGVKWVRTEGGKYEVKLDKDVGVADMGWQKKKRGKVEDE